jgi:hypothetical protein
MTSWLPLLDAVFASAGWGLALLLLGLWWGERGRRIDAQRAAGVHERGKGTAVETDPDAMAEGSQILRERERNQLVAFFQGKGFSARDSLAEAERMLEEIEGMPPEATW